MKFVVLSLLMAISAKASAMCGIPPIPPIGMQMVCICNASGTNCSWVAIKR